MYQMIEARVAVHPKLLRLSGRLDLAMSQVSLRGNTNHPISCIKYRFFRCLFAAKTARPAFRNRWSSTRTTLLTLTMLWHQAAAAAVRVRRMMAATVA
jgi:hypothetical protein